MEVAISPFPLRKNSKNGGGHLPIPFKIIRKWRWSSPHPHEKNKKNGGDHLPIHLREHSKHGGGQPSLCSFLLEFISLFLLPLAMKGGDHLPLPFEEE